MRKIITVIFLVASLTLGVKAEPLSPADVKSLLERIREKRAAAPSMQADFQEKRKVHLLDEPINSSGKIWFQAPNKFRVERKGNAPSITVSDGQQLWIYYPNFKSAEHYSLAKRSPLDAARFTVGSHRSHRVICRHHAGGATYARARGLGTFARSRRGHGAQRGGLDAPAGTGATDG